MSLQELTEEILRPDICVLPTILEKKAESIGDKPLIVFDGGPTWTYGEAHDLAKKSAAALQALGVERGERVLVWMPDGTDMVRVALGIYYAGAVYAPLNPAYKGALLEHAIGLADASLLIAHATYLDQLEGLALGSLKSIVAIGGAEGLRADVEVLSGDVLGPPPGSSYVPPDPPIEAWDVHSIFFTSGTTGPSKAVMSTHAHIYQMATDGLHFLTSDDRYMSPSAFFHIAGAYVLWGVIAKSATAVIVGRFKADEFWDQIDRTGTTGTILIGAMADFLLKAPPGPKDRDHNLKKVLQQPVTHDPVAFAERFGVEIYTQFDMTEVGPSIISEPLSHVSHLDKGYCGKKRDGFEVRLVDENDCEVPIGTPGELSVRCDVPWVITPGYFGMPAATATAWRNGWFHTGDVLKQDEDGNYYYVDRTKDVIRRRGENISSYEVETEVLSHPSVNAVAAYAALVQNGEGEVMIAVEPKNGREVNPQSLCDHLLGRMTGFMVPRFIRTVAELPRSATDKINKAKLREEGVTSDTWDRKEADLKGTSEC